MRIRKVLPRAGAALLAVICASLICSSVAMADVVTMKNGDRISGKVVAMAGGKLTIETSYAGKLTIDWDQVEGLVTDQPIKVKLTDGSQTAGQAVAADKDVLSLAGTGKKQTVLAQVEAINPPDPRKLRIKGQVNLGTDIRTGNTEKQRLDADGRVVFRWGVVHRIRVGGESHREENKGTSTVENDLAYLEYNRFISERWYAFGNLRYSRDPFKALSYRYGFGGGMGYQVWQTDITNLSLELGPNYFIEDTTRRGEREFVAARWALNFDYWIWPGRIQLYHYHEIFSRVDAPVETFITTRTGLTVPIGGGIAASVEYSWDWDNDPDPGKQEEDARLLFKLGYHW
jgi:putative salt-induced outer membrane protein YdiY